MDTGRENSVTSFARQVAARSVPETLAHDSAGASGYLLGLGLGRGRGPGPGADG